MVAKMKKPIDPQATQECRRLRAAFRMVVQSVRKAQNKQSETEKEKQMKRLLRQLRMAEGVR